MNTSHKIAEANRINVLKSGAVAAEAKAWKKLFKAGTTNSSNRRQSRFSQNHLQPAIREVKSCDWKD